MRALAIAHPRPRPAPRVARVRSLDDLPTDGAALDRVTLLDPAAAHEPEEALERLAAVVRRGGVVVLATPGAGRATLERVRAYATWVGLADACILGGAVVARRGD